MLILGKFCERSDSLVHRLVRVFLRADAHVAVPVEVDGERVPVRHQEPLPDVELAPVDQQRLLCNGEKAVTVEGSNRFFFCLLGSDHKH